MGGEHAALAGSLNKTLIDERGSEAMQGRREERKGKVSLAGNHLTTVSDRFLSYVSARGLSHVSDTTFRVAAGRWRAV